MLLYANAIDGTNSVSGKAHFMTVTIGINGFGRIGRCTLAHITEAARNDVQVVKINATGPIETNAHLLKYDSIHGRFGHRSASRATRWTSGAGR
jgi:glyceraldehyde 3-phosphate dehydrogenase